MKTKIIEATNVEAGGFNYGKFMLGRMDGEWGHKSAIDDKGYGLLGRIGWTRQHLWVMDLQTGEGACFLPGGHAANDLDKHKVWVCPMFEPFLQWLYTQQLDDLDALPDLVQLEAASDMRGYRRQGSS